MAKYNLATVDTADAPEEELAIEDVLHFIKQAIEDKKGEDVLVLDLEGQVDYLDYLIVCSGFTEIHNQAIAQNISSELARHDIIAEDIQGLKRGDWILLDFDVIVVHIFLPSLREFYRLEELWSGGKEVQV